MFYSHCYLPNNNTSDFFKQMLSDYKHLQASIPIAMRTILEADNITLVFYMFDSLNLLSKQGVLPCSLHLV